MMKFIIRNIKNGCRQGVLSEFPNHPDKLIDTPFCMLYTRAGSAPHLARDVLKRVESIPAVAHMPLNLLAENHEVVEKFQQGVGKFTAMQDFVMYCSLHDPSTMVKTGFNDKHGIAVWGRGGKLKLDSELFMKIQESFQPDFYQALSDGDTDCKATKKRCCKAVDRTLTFLDDIIDKHKQSQRLRNTAIFGALVGGVDPMERKRCAKETSSRPVDGFVFEGFFTPGPDSEKFQLFQYQELWNQIMEHLPEDKPRLMQCIWTPDKVIQGVEMGLDIFDSSYPYVVTERFSALCFNYTLPCLETEENILPNSYEIDLSQKKYFEDLGPILKDCQCYCCQNYSRSYIHHLLNTKELLARILLQMHNFHHYFKFFESVRKCLADDKWEEFKNLILKQKPQDSAER